MKKSRRNANRWNVYTDQRHRRPSGSSGSTQGSNGRGTGRSRSERPEFAPVEEEQRESPRMKRRAFREEYEPEFYSEAERRRRSSEAAFEEYGPQFYDDIGRRGSESVRDEFDPEFYNEMNYRDVEAMGGEYEPEFYRETTRRRSWAAPWNEYSPEYYDAYGSSQRHSTIPEHLRYSRLSHRNNRSRLPHEYEHNARTGSRSRFRGGRNY